MSKYRKYCVSPKLKFGDFLKDVGQVAQNVGVGGLDVGLSILGMDNVVDRSYAKNADGFANSIAKAYDITGDISKKVAPVAANFIVPGSGALISGAQTVGNAVDSKSSDYKYLNNNFKYGGNLSHINNGGKHEENPMGGVPLGKNMVEEGETIDTNKGYVFSNSIKIDKDLMNEFNLKGGLGKTFAEYSKLLEKKGGRKGDVLDDKAQKMMQDRLIEAQESFKMSDFSSKYNTEFKKYGGYFKKMEEGGFLEYSDFLTKYNYSDDIDARDAYNTYTEMYNENPSVKKSFNNLYDQWVNNRQERENNLDLNSNKPLLDPIKKELGLMDFKDETTLTGNSQSFPTNKKLNYNEFMYKYDYKNDQDAKDSYNTYKKMYNQNPYAEDSRAQKTGDVLEYLKSDKFKTQANNVMSLAPMVANTISSFKHDKLDNSKYTLKNKVNPYYMNIDPMLTDNKETFARTQDAMKSGSGGSAGTYLSNLGALSANKYKADANVRMGKYNADKQSDMQSQIANIDVDKYNSQMNYQTDDWNMRSSEAAKNLAREAASNLGEYAWKNNNANTEKSFWEEYMKKTAKDFYEEHKYGGYLKKKKKK